MDLVAQYGHARRSMTSPVVRWDSVRDNDYN